MRFHKDGTLPTGHEVFVFGSNLAGRHGAGAALVAFRDYGAVVGCGEGHWGRSYAIPTKDHRIRTLPLSQIERYVNQFLAYARGTPAEFFVTAIGCGLAGYSHADIAPMFRDAPDNCSLPDCWQEYLTGDE